MRIRRFILSMMLAESPDTVVADQFYAEVPEIKAGEPVSLKTLQECGVSLVTSSVSGFESLKSVACLSEYKGKLEGASSAEDLVTI